MLPAKGILRLVVDGRIIICSSRILNTLGIDVFSCKQSEFKDIYRLVYITQCIKTSTGFMLAAQPFLNAPSNKEDLSI